jgi:hypothetical protein
VLKLRKTVCGEEYTMCISVSIGQNVQFNNGDYLKRNVECEKKNAKTAQILEKMGRQNEEWFYRLLLLVRNTPLWKKKSHWAIQLQ